MWPKREGICRKRAIAATMHPLPGPHRSNPRPPSRTPRLPLRERRPNNMIGSLNSNVPSGPLEGKWEKHKFESRLINPANKRKYSVIVVGSGLAGASAAATLAELGYAVKCFCYQDSPRRA